MPFPFSQLPTFAELKTILAREFACQFKSEEVRIEVLNDSYFIHYFDRVVGGRVLSHSVVIDDEGERITPTLLRSICENLEIPLDRFGLELGPSSWED